MRRERPRQSADSRRGSKYAGFASRIKPDEGVAFLRVWQGLRSRPRRRPSAFADSLVVERASLARPTSSGWQRRPWATADRLFSNPATRSDGVLRRVRIGCRVSGRRPPTSHFSPITSHFSQKKFAGQTFDQLREVGYYIDSVRTQ